MKDGEGPREKEVAECWETEQAWHNGQSTQRRLQGTKNRHFLGLGMGGGSRVGDELPSFRDPSKGTVQLESMQAEQGAEGGQKESGGGRGSNKLPSPRPPGSSLFHPSLQVQSWPASPPLPITESCHSDGPCSLSHLPAPSSRGARTDAILSLSCLTHWLPLP